MRTRTSTQKRQKELARKEKQRDKAARRMQRKLEPKQSGEADLDSVASEFSPAENEPVVGNE